MKTNSKNSKVVTKAVKNNKIYIFYREDMFYPIMLKDDNDAIINAKHNKGTIKVKDSNGRLVWEKVLYKA